MKDTLEEMPGRRRGPSTEELLAAADAADRAADAGTAQEEMRAVLEVLAHKETIRLALLAQKMNRIAASHRDQERLPLRDDGDDIGRVEARIPSELFWHLQQQNNFGMDGFTDNGGMKDFLTAYPQCRVKTVSGKIQSGYGSKPARRRMVFGRGTLTLPT